MSEFLLEQALFQRDGPDESVILGQSPGFREDWLPEILHILSGFGVRPAGQACPLAVFAQPLGKDHVAVVQAADRPGAGAGPLRFHVLVVARKSYEEFLGDPFQLAARLPVDWERRADLPTLTWPALPPPPRTVAQVQEVLKRVKANALKEDEDPEAADFQRTPENSQSPALLGGVQVLVDGGKLVFERPAPDPELVQGLWTLLPNRTRGRLWPASFAFGNELGFDVIVTPRLNLGDYEGYNSEDMASAYPQGSYELALQTAAEAGNQRELDAVLDRRDSSETLRLAAFLLIAMIAIVVGSSLLFPPGDGPPPSRPGTGRAAAAAGVVGVGDPLTAAGMLDYYLKLEEEKK